MATKNSRSITVARKAVNWNMIGVTSKKQRQLATCVTTKIKSNKKTFIYH